MDHHERKEKIRILTELASAGAHDDVHAKYEQNRKDSQKAGFGHKVDGGISSAALVREQPQGVGQELYNIDKLVTESTQC